MELPTAQVVNIRSVADGPILLWCLSDLAKFIGLNDLVISWAVRKIDPADKVRINFNPTAIVQRNHLCVPTSIALSILERSRQVKSKEAAEFIRKSQSDLLILRAN